MFSPLHELLVDDLAGIVLAGLDVHGLLDDGIGAAAQGLACAILDVGTEGLSAARAKEKQA